MTSKSPPRFKIGTVYKLPRNQHGLVCTVVDIHTTTNAAGEVVRVSYVTTHEFCGQTVFDYNVCDTTIARSLFAAGVSII